MQIQPEVCGKHLPIAFLAAHFEGASLSDTEAQTDGQSSCGRCDNLVSVPKAKPDLWPPQNLCYLASILHLLELSTLLQDTG